MPRTNAFCCFSQWLRLLYERRMVSLAMRRYMAKVLLRRGWKTQIEEPSTEAIAGLLRVLALDQGPPEFQLEFEPLLEIPMRSTSILGLYLLYDSDSSPSGWNVRFSFPKATSSQYLAFTHPTQEEFDRRTRCGCV